MDKILEKYGVKKLIFGREEVGRKFFEKVDPKEWGVEAGKSFSKKIFGGRGVLKFLKIF